MVYLCLRMILLMKRLPNMNSYLLNSTLHGGKCTFLQASARQSVFAGVSQILFAHTNCLYLSGYCKALAPEYEQAAAVLSAQDPPLTIAKVDATENEVLSERMGIDGYPTLFFFTYVNAINP